MRERWVKKYIIFLLVVIQIFTLTIPVNADNVKNCYTHERIYTDTTVIPMYIPHPCHSGISHAYCYYYSCIYKSCGCWFDRYQCCCGELMPYRYIDVYYCDIHSRLK